MRGIVPNVAGDWLRVLLLLYPERSAQEFPGIANISKSILHSVGIT